jgi:hypothetical protein
VSKKAQDFPLLRKVSEYSSARIKLPLASKLDRRFLNEMTRERSRGRSRLADSDCLLLLSSFFFFFASHQEEKYGKIP